MKLIRKYLRVIVFVLILLGAGAGIPIPVFFRDDHLNESQVEQVDEVED